MGFFNSKLKPQLKNINGYIIDETGKLVDVPEGLQIYNIPKEVKRLDSDVNFVTNKAFSKMSKASEIIFEDDSISEIPNNYFTYGLSFLNLKKINLPNGIKKLGNRCIDPVKTKYNLPVTIEHLGTNIYPEVQKLVLGNNIKSLGHSFASGDTNLLYMEVAGTIKELPIQFVNQCKNLKTLILHEGIEKAGDMAFRGLNSLEYVELPDSFKQPFYREVDDRSSSNKRGNSSYKSADFDAQQNSILTIKKIHNSIPYTFQVRKSDFCEISFQNTTAFIKSTSKYKNISIDLSKLNPNAICQVNIRESKFEQVFAQKIQQPVQNQIPIQQIPIQSQFKQSAPVQPIQQQKPILSTSNPIYYNENETIQYINEIWNYIYNTELYKNLNYAIRIRLHTELTNTLKQKIRIIEKGKKFSEDFIISLLNNEIKKINEIVEQEKSSDENLFYVAQNEEPEFKEFKR